MGGRETVHPFHRETPAQERNRAEAEVDAITDFLVWWYEQEGVAHVSTDGGPENRGMPVLRSEVPDAVRTWQRQRGRRR